MRCSILLTLVPILCGCSSPPPEAHSDSDRGVEQQKNIAAAFSVDVQLSQGARKKLVDSKETIIVAGYFTGHPKEGTEAKYLDIKSGDVIVGDVQREIRPGETAIFNQLNLNPDAVSRTDSQGLHVLISVFSGRESSKDNLLRCEVYDGAIESLSGRTIPIRCQLIAEPFSELGR